MKCEYVLRSPGKLQYKIDNEDSFATLLSKHEPQLKYFHTNISHTLYWFPFASLRDLPGAYAPQGMGENMFD